MINLVRVRCRACLTTITANSEVFGDPVEGKTTELYCPECLADREFVYTDLQEVRRGETKT